MKVLRGRHVASWETLEFAIVRHDGFQLAGERPEPATVTRLMTRPYQVHIRLRAKQERAKEEKIKIERDVTAVSHMHELLSSKTRNQPNTHTHTIQRSKRPLQTP